MKHHRSRGRPPLDAADPSVPVTVSIPSKQLAVMAAQAKRLRTSVQDSIRRACRRSIDAELKRNK